MKRHLIRITIGAFLLHLFIFRAYAQIFDSNGNSLTCAQPEMLANMLSADPQTLQRHQDLEAQIYQAFSNGSIGSSSRSGTLYTLPVVVHIIHNNGAENISDAQVMQGIADLNAAYANTGYYDSLTGVSTQIQFCLAQRDPNGQPTNGITRNVSSLTNLNMSQDIALKNLNRWNTRCYLNIWLVKMICDYSCNIAGYAYLPSSHGASWDGLVCMASYFGSTRANSNVQVHEMGHYLGLYHTFEGGCTNNNCLANGDKICDTPPDNSTGYYSCGAVVNTCTTDALSGFTTDQPDEYRDYMDYGNLHCYTLFTQNQKDCMLWVIQNVRSSLLACQSCLSPCVNPAQARFTSSAQSVSVGGTVNFTNTSTNAVTYTWLNNGIQFSSATNAMATFNSSGTYIIKLIADNGNANCVDEFSDTIIVSCTVTALFNQSAFQILPGQSVTFTNTSSNATNYAWMMDGASVASTLNYSYTFNLSGDYSVYLIAANSLCADTTSIFNFIHVGSGCSSSFTYTPSNPSACNPVTFIPDSTCRYSNYHWSFCEFDSVGLPATATYSTTSYGSTEPDGGAFYRDRDGNYHLFFADNGNLANSNRFYRMDFGNSMTNTPVVSNLVISGITDNANHGISIVDVDGIYYAFMLTNITLYRAKIGPDITNDTLSTSVVGNMTNAISWGHEVDVVRETNNFWVIIASRNGFITVAYLGSNIENNALQFTKHKTNLASEAYFGDVYIKSKGKHYIFGMDFNNGLIRFDFGNSLANTPTKTNLGAFGSGYMCDLTLFPNCDGSYDGYLFKENLSNHKLLHFDSIAAMPTIKATFPIAVPRIASSSNFLITDMGLTVFVGEPYSNQVERFTFGSCNSNNAYSQDKFPPPISFTTTGSHYVRLVVDQGLPSESSFCDEVVVSGINTPPLNLGPDTAICAGSSVILHAGPWYSGYNWTGGFTDSVYTVYNPGTYWATVTNYCGTALTDSINVTVDSAAVFTLNDTTICKPLSTLLTGPSGYASYQWLPSAGLSCPTCRVTVATPAANTIYSLQATTATGCLSIGTMQVIVTACSSLDDNSDSGNAALVLIKPNPANDEVLITVSDNLTGGELFLSDLEGRILIRNRISNSNIKVQTSTFANGIYFLRLRTDAGLLTRRLVISHP